MEYSTSTTLYRNNNLIQQGVQAEGFLMQQVIEAGGRMRVYGGCHTWSMLGNDLYVNCMSTCKANAPVSGSMGIKGEDPAMRGQAWRALGT